MDYITEKPREIVNRPLAPPESPGVSMYAATVHIAMNIIT